MKCTSTNNELTVIYIYSLTETFRKQEMSGLGTYV